MGELKALSQRYRGDKLALISISADEDESAWRQFIAKKKMFWHQCRDSDHKMRDSFAITAFPTYIVIDGDGILKQRIVGMNPQESIVHRLKAMLASMPQLEAAK